MQKLKVILTHKDPKLVNLITACDHKTLAIWSKDCALRVLHYFENRFPTDPRPRNALETLQNWLDTGAFSMAVIRKASLDSHTAAREVGEDNAARSAARACGQAVATAHVKTHAIGGAMYALQAIQRATRQDLVDAALEKERAWQYKSLQKLVKNS